MIHLGYVLLRYVLFYTGLLIFREKNAKFRGIFRGKFAEKSADFAGFLREKSQNSQKNRLISQDFSGKKSNFKGFSGLTGVSLRAGCWLISPAEKELTTG